MEALRSRYSVVTDELYSLYCVAVKFYKSTLSMARVFKKSLLCELSGELGGVVFKRYKYGTVVSKKPDMSRVKKTPLQEVKRNTFKEAVAYAQEIIRNRQKKAAYAKKLKKGQTVYHAAIKEYMVKNSKK